MNTFFIRESQTSDLKALMAMYENSRQVMRRSGNSNQWVGGYPSTALIESDISNEVSHIIEQNGTPVGVFTFIIGRDPTYEQIFHGNWIDDERPYGTIHRIAAAPGCHGIFNACIEWCKRQIPSLRIDTHRDNATMLHLIEKSGFTYCGIILVTDGTERKAFQITDTGQICEPLKQYIKAEILPRYDNFDPAHRRDHADKVIANSLHLAKIHHAEPNMSYAIAAYHDLGLIEGREKHHTVSKQILLTDKTLLNWFSEKQIKIMGDAVEDHRASAKNEPRTIYGKIVAEADRDIEPLSIIRRTVQYGLGHYPNLNAEEHWRRTLNHLEEKYGNNGYLKLWLSGSPNEANLAKLRQIIDDREKLRELFKHLYEEEVQQK